MKHRFSILAFVVLSLALFAWADKTFTFTNNSIVPSADGKVTVGTDNNGNNAFDIHVYHLAHPNELNPAKSVYVVWAQRNGYPADNLGQIQVNHDLEGKFHGKTTYKHFDLFITGEDNPSVQQPSGTEVLRTKISH